ncbi:DUF1906 domain-containing protein [Phytoactinopolyspora alkaliphila]|uniref:DUF1906 domain-containing protein n=1 Tax=Phytoactinopolyspora alkaliphila TaxID=1783498 RepID=A0A6N9YKV3_9ACTN|nr:glycoside hydrolase domain-containing protein [Phytoactinopolyspora alkaliphila]NED95701.1 DUF1906 domain-containing protein [Phytoactinopolyspora alkaliphila]
MDRQATRQRSRAARVIAARIGAASAASMLIVSGLTSSAVAEPETPVTYPKGASATRAGGLGFDTCTAPSLSTLRAWRSSSFSTVNVYFGGINRGCRQPQLSRTWVREATAMGWKLMPTYVGRQPSCVIGRPMHTFSRSDAASFGRSNARDAIKHARNLGLLPGSALYADIEHYDRSKQDCRIAVRRYISEWTKTLHASGYLSGVYVHHASGLRDLSDSYTSSKYARPDAVWMAKWDRDTSLTGWPRTPNSRWAHAQRAKQYRGEHKVTYGGATLKIDSNSIDAPVATVARAYRVTSSTPLNARKGPGTSYPAVRNHAPGSTVSVICQGRGQKIGSTSVWNRLSNGSWVSDRYVSTPSSSGFSTAAVPRCAYPGQVTSGIPLNARSGPGTSHRLSGNPLPRGSLAWITCQTKGSAVDGTSVWNRLTDGRWVSDRYVSTRSGSSWSAPVPRCP